MRRDHTQRPTWAEIDLDNLAFNFRSVRQFVGPDIVCMGVIKADAYGHGAIQCGGRLVRAGAEWLGVATVEEGLELRAARITAPILILGGFLPDQIEIGLANDLTPVVFSLDQAEAIDGFARLLRQVVKVHVKFDTGMGRLGFRYDEAPAIAKIFAGLDSIRVEGLMTHFAAADDLGSNFTQLQISRFEDAKNTFRLAGIVPKYADLANSPGAVAHPDARSNMVRLGGVLYGLGGDVLPKGIETPALRAVMSLRSRIATIKRISSGESVGYSRTYVAEKDTLVATVPIGYHDGFRRSLSNVGKVIVRGSFADVIGRVSMDWITIDITNVADASPGDVVTLIGRDGDAEIKAEDIARELGTISYEVTCGISRRVPRLFREK